VKSGEITDYDTRKRMKEAKATGAEALVSACPWWERTLRMLFRRPVRSWKSTIW